MKQVVILIFSCVFLSVSAMEQAIQDGNWYTVCNLIQKASDDEYLATNQNLNACPGENDPMIGNLESSLFGILLVRSCNTAYHTVRYESILTSLINTKKIDLDLPNNKKVVPALEFGYESVGRGAPWLRTKLLSIQAKNSIDTNFNLCTIGIAAVGLGVLVSIIWYAS